MSVCPPALIERCYCLERELTKFQSPSARRKHDTSKSVFWRTALPFNQAQSAYQLATANRLLHCLLRLLHPRRSS